MKRSSDPDLGNSATEQGQHEEGKDFRNISTTTVVPAGEPITVTATATPIGTVLLPQQRTTAEFHREIGELQPAKSEELLADLCEQTVAPIVHCASPDRLAQVLKREHLIWYGVRNTMLMAMNGDRILIEQDTLESEHSCRNCKGKGHLDVECVSCNNDPALTSSCSDCLSASFDTETKCPSGHVPCTICRGTGWRAGIIIPEVAQAKPVSGIVVSLGPQTQLMHLGDRVLHSKYAGNSFTTPEGRTYTMMHESEVLGLLQQMEVK